MKVNLPPKVFTKNLDAIHPTQLYPKCQTLKPTQNGLNFTKHY